MVKEVKIKSLAQVEQIVNLASMNSDDIGVHDRSGAIADAKSILGLMSLNYSEPVLLVSENERLLNKVYNGVVRFAN